jgi:cell division septation protein DedD
MDRRVKERLVGASILVVLLVLIVPELLSGPAPPASSPMTTGPGAVAPGAAAPGAGMPANGAPAASAPESGRTVTVDLATSKAPAQEAGVEAASAARVQSAAERAQASTVEPPLLPAATTAAAARRSAPPPLLETPASSPRSTPGGAKPAARAPAAGLPAAVGHGWAVQLGNFASRDNADKLVRQLKGQGFSVYVSSVGVGHAARYRVRIGPMADHEGAAQTVAKLKSLGQAASIVRPGA